jgi:membrane protein
MPFAAADTPLDIPAEGWWEVAKALYRNVQQDRVLAVAGGVTYYGLLALFPTITALVSFYGLFNDRSEATQDLAMLATVIPPGAYQIVQDQVSRIVSGGGLALGLAGLSSLGLALWSSNSGMKAMIDALNVANRAEERRSFIMLNLVSFAFTLSAMAFLLALLSVIAVVPALLALVRLEAWTGWLIWAGRWPMVAAVVCLALAVLYRWGPNVPDARWRWISPGSVLATVLLSLMSMGFSWYAANFGRFNETYGSLGAAIAFMTWLWLASISVLIGAELNAELDRQSKARAAHHPPERDDGKASAH